MFFPPLFFPSLIQLNFSRPVTGSISGRAHFSFFPFPSILIFSSPFPMPSFPFSYFHPFLFFLLILFFLYFPFLSLFPTFFITNFSSLFFLCLPPVSFFFHPFFYSPSFSPPLFVLFFLLDFFLFALQSICLPPLFSTYFTSFLKEKSFA